MFTRVCVCVCVCACFINMCGVHSKRPSVYYVVSVHTSTWKVSSESVFSETKGQSAARKCFVKFPSVTLIGTWSWHLFEESSFKARVVVKSEWTETWQERRTWRWWRHQIRTHVAGLSPLTHTGHKGLTAGRPALSVCLQIFFFKAIWFLWEEQTFITW